MNYDAASTLADLEASIAYHAAKACIAAAKLGVCSIPVSLRPDARAVMVLVHEISSFPGAPDLGPVRRALGASGAEA